ncbi:conserved Plasmodium protein, unknown function [Plasmodium ovale curtisi]|uniref:Allantoicase domain-containing protein n=1 Tax=Plasmodium ovale curtisi TaxID=864141 RepID=A0A1A8VLJ2_PLAOA|nr:conserved Plasmodium protein, unknown function [Plasmodium ovale curtisi]
MSEGKAENGAYINNPEFPFKNLNIRKIERIRKSTSLNNNFPVQKGSFNEESKMKESTSKQSNVHNFTSSLSKKLSRSKNFIERNIEKISLLSKKNDLFIKSKKTCNRNHIVGYELQRDTKKNVKQMKDKTGDGAHSGLSKNRGSGANNFNVGGNHVGGGNIGCKNVTASKQSLSEGKNKNILIKVKHKSAEKDASKETNLPTNSCKERDNWAHVKQLSKVNEKGSKDYSSVSFEWSKSLAKPYDIKSAHKNCSNTFLIKQKSLLREEKVNKNCKNKNNRYDVGSRSAEHDKSEPNLREYVEKSTNLQKDEWSTMKDVAHWKELPPNGKDTHQYDVRENHPLSKKTHRNESESRCSHEEENSLVEYEDKRKGNQLRESSNLISSYEEYDEVDKHTKVDISQNRRNIWNEKELEHYRNLSVNLNFMSYDLSRYEDKCKPIGENERSYDPKGNMRDNYNGRSKVRKEKKEGDAEEEIEVGDEIESEKVYKNQRGYSVNNKYIPSVNPLLSCSNSDTGMEKKKKVLKKTISLNDNSSVDTSTNYSLINNKECELLNEKRILKSGSNNKLNSFYPEFEVSSGQAELFSGNVHKEFSPNSFNRGINENVFSDDKKLRENFVGVHNNIRSFRKLYSGYLPNEGGEKRKGRIEGRMDEQGDGRNENVSPEEMPEAKESMKKERNYIKENSTDEISLIHNADVLGDYKHTEDACVTHDNSSHLENSANDELEKRVEHCKNNYQVIEVMNRKGEHFEEESFPGKNNYENVLRQSEYNVCESKNEKDMPKTHFDEQNEEDMPKTHFDEQNEEDMPKTHFDEQNEEDMPKTHFDEQNEEDMSKTHFEEQNRDEQPCEIPIKKNNKNSEDIPDMQTHQLTILRSAFSNAYPKDSQWEKKSEFRESPNRSDNTKEHENRHNNIYEERDNNDFTNSNDCDIPSSRKADPGFSEVDYTPSYRNYVAGVVSGRGTSEGKGEEEEEDYQSVTEKESGGGKVEEAECTEGHGTLGKQLQNENRDEGGSGGDDEQPDNRKQELGEEEGEGEEEKEEKEEEKKKRGEDRATECGKTYIDKNEIGDVRRNNYVFPFEPFEGGNMPSLNTRDVEEHTKRYGILEQGKNTSNNIYAYEKRNVSNECNLRIDEPELNSQGEGKNKFLCSSNDTYDVDVVKMYNSKLTQQSSNKKQNKLLNKNMILKEIFGSNYESSLKNNLNESSNLPGGEEECEEETYKGEVSNSDGYEEELNANERANSQLVGKNDDKCSFYVRNKSLSKEMREAPLSQLDKTEVTYKDDVLCMEIQNEEDSLLKRYEENSSPLILSKPLFNDKTSESSYSRIDIKERNKNESVILGNHNTFLEKGKFTDVRNVSRTSELMVNVNAQEIPNETHNEKYTLKEGYVKCRSGVVYCDGKDEQEGVGNREKGENGLLRKEERYVEESRIGEGEGKCTVKIRNAEERTYERFEKDSANEGEEEWAQMGEDSKRGKKKKEEEITKERSLEFGTKSKCYSTYSDYIKIEKDNSTSRHVKKVEELDDYVYKVKRRNDENIDRIGSKKKKDALSKYMDKQFLIYKDNPFSGRENGINRSKSHLNHETLRKHYGDTFFKDRERELLFDSMSDNYNYLMKEKKFGRNSNRIGLYENGRSRPELTERRDASGHLRSRISDDYYLDYIKNKNGSSGNSGRYSGRHSDWRSGWRSDCPSGRHIGEAIERKEETKFGIARNSNDYLEDVHKKKKKKLEHINGSNVSYGNNSDYSKGALYHSINETTNSSQTIVSKRSKYILKQSNSSSVYDDVPLLFNFVNCCSIVLGSEIIYVTDETYGKCENILKDKPFHTNVERGYYEYFSNDLYNVMNNELSANINEANRFGMSKSVFFPNDVHLSKEESTWKDASSRYGIGGAQYSFECPGWLTKRRIKKYFDFCIIKLCKPTLIKGIDIDTNDFLGNYAPYVSIEGAYIEDEMLMSSTSFSKYVDNIKYENKKKNDILYENNFCHFEKGKENGDSKTLRGIFFHKMDQRSEGYNNPIDDSREKGEKNSLFNSREEVELVIDGKTYFKRNKYFYEPILIDPIDKSDQEYENYVEILRYNDKFKNLKNNPKSTSFVANGNEYRYIDNKLYTLVDVTRDIVSKYPDLHKNCLQKMASTLFHNIRDGNNRFEVNTLQKNFEKNEKSILQMNEKIGMSMTNGSDFRGTDERSRGNEDVLPKHFDVEDHCEEENPILLSTRRYNPNTLYLDNDYTVEKQIYNDLHKKYQWVSILEDERMNPGFKNYNHNCFNINTCNKIFTHLIVCLLPDGGINKLRVYGEIKISEKEKKKNYKKIINVSNILDGSNVVYTTDEFYGKSENILIDQKCNYVMGWQTRRLINRPLRYVENLCLNNICSIFFNNNYCIIKLSFITYIKYIEINTIFYEYNFPLCVSIDHCYLKDIHSEEKSKQMKYFNDNIQNIEWKELLPLSYIKGNHINFFTICGCGMSSSHLRLNIYPDGGINTIKVYGTVMEV